MQTNLLKTFSVMAALATFTLSSHPALAQSSSVSSTKYAAGSTHSERGTVVTVQDFCENHCTDTNNQGLIKDLQQCKKACISMKMKSQ